MPNNPMGITRPSWFYTRRPTKKGTPAKGAAAASGMQQLCSIMKRHQFTTIEEVHQASRLLRPATRVAARREGFYRVELYQAPRYYMEVYRHEHFNVIIRMTRFTGTEHLEPYLRSISLEGLLSL